LNAFSGSEQVRIDCRSADRGANLAHRFAHRIKKGSAGVFHKMPAACDLDGVWQGFRHRQGIALRRGRERQ
jgi:hypothetical protein